MLHRLGSSIPHKSEAPQTPRQAMQPARTSLPDRPSSCPGPGPTTRRGPPFKAGAEAGASSAPQLSCTAHPPLLCIPLSSSCGLHSCIVRRIFHTHIIRKRGFGAARVHGQGVIFCCAGACCSWVSRILHAAYTLELLVAAICTSSRTFCFKTSCSSLLNFPFHLRICFHGSCQAWGVTVAQLGLSYGYWAANELNL